MANATWLPTLPQHVSGEAYQGAFLNNLNQTTPLTGVGSSNPIYTGVPELLTCSVSLDTDQLTDFEEWYQNTLGWGSLEFDGLPHPQTGTDCTMKFFVGQGGTPYGKAYKSGRWTLTMSLAVLV